jgi:nucleoside-diphosphate-sugar epimerase
MSRESDPAVLVTGATGFIGRHLVTRLLVAGRRLVILARRGCWRLTGIICNKMSSSMTRSRADCLAVTALNLL